MRGSKTTAYINSTIENKGCKVHFRETTCGRGTSLGNGMLLRYNRHLCCGGSKSGGFCLQGGVSLKAYVTTTRELKWYNRGNLLVSDSANKCVHLFRAQDGTYLGVLLKEGEPGLESVCNIQKIRWCDKTKTLLVAHRRQPDDLPIWLTALELRLPTH